MTVGHKIVYTNDNICGRIPKDEEVIGNLRQHMASRDNQQGGDNVEPRRVDTSGCCCTGNTGEGGQGCCPSPLGASLHGTETGIGTRYLDIEFLYIDLSVCTRCQGTEGSLQEAVNEVARLLAATGVEVKVRSIHIQTAEQALEQRFVSSPTIRINGRDIQLDVKESLCESCGDLCGEDVDCRVWVYQGKEYSVPPKAMIMDAILREVYGGSIQPPPERDSLQELPENLKRFFDGVSRDQS
ncbi:MAG: DUF2703 domain-containing protein [Candidatus Desulforudaceae bacterium]